MIIPAILEKDFNEIKKKIALLSKDAHFFHIDVADNEFVPNITFLEGQKLKDFFKSEENLSNVSFEAHLMVKNPHFYYQKWIEGGAETIIFHIESFFNIRKKVRQFAVNNLCNLIKKAGAQPVIALNPETKIDLIEQYLLKKIFRVHFLSVHPGFQGNNFIPEVIEKIKSLKEKYPDVKISIDGGINENTILKVKAAGAEIFGVGSAIYNTADPLKAYKNLETLISS